MEVQTLAKQEITATINKKERFKNVDFFRFLFAIIILLYHFGTSPGSFGILLKQDSSTFQNIYILFHNGFICVDFFFLISGFFLFKSIKPSNDTIYFIKSKIIRLVPLIWFSIVIYAIFSVFIKNFNFQINNNLLSIFLLDQIGFNKCVSCTPQAWFVSSLFWVSLFYFYLNKIFDKKYLNIIIWFLVTISTSFIINCNYPGFASNVKNSQIFINQGIMRGISGIGLGYFILMLYNSNFLKKVNIKNRIIITGLEIYLAGFLVYYLVISGKTPGNCYFLYIINFAILFYLLLIKQGLISKLLDNNISEVLGKWSYSIYIMHIMIRNIMNCTIIYPHKEFVLAHPIFIFSSGIVIAVIVGILTYYFFEKPITKYLKNKFLTKQALAVQK